MSAVPKFVAVEKHVEWDAAAAAFAVCWRIRIGLGADGTFADRVEYDDHYPALLDAQALAKSLGIDDVRDASDWLEDL